MDGQQYAPQLSGVLYTQQTAAGDKHMNYNASRHWTGTSLRVVGPICALTRGTPPTIETRESEIYNG